MNDEDEREPMPGLMRLEGASTERAQAFFHAAASFYKEKPWRIVSDRRPFKVSCPDFARSPVHVLVMGNAGMEFGLGLFFNPEDLERLYELGPNATMERVSFRTASVLFSDPTFLPFDDLDAIERHGWPIAGRNAYPHLFQVLPEAKPVVQPPSSEQVDIFEACLLALPPTIKKHRAEIRADEPFEEEVEVDTFHGRRQLRIASSRLQSNPISQRGKPNDTETIF